MSQFLIVDGYSPESRDQFREVGMKLAGELYSDLLMKYLPGADYGIWYSSDPGAPDISDETLADCAGILWPGCNLTVYHDDPRVKRHLDLMRRQFDAGVPGFGSCWAIQVAAAVTGGEVGLCPKGREMGMGDKIMLTEVGHGHPMFDGKPEVFSGFVSHDDEVTRLPECATRLAGNAWSEVQAAEFRKGDCIFWATQYHPEYNLKEMAALIRARIPKLIKLGYFRDEAEAHGYAGRLRALYDEPGRKDLRWQLKIDDDVISDEIRECEFKNWIRHVIQTEVGK